jgi:phosphoribosylglycinamide formyltransferase-1
LHHGNGTTLQCVIDNIKSNNLNATINLVVSDNPNCYALKRASLNNIPTYVIKGKTTTEIDSELCNILLNYKIDLIVLVRLFKINWSTINK